MVQLYKLEIKERETAYAYPRILWARENVNIALTEERNLVTFSSELEMCDSREVSVTCFGIFLVSIAWIWVKLVLYLILYLERLVWTPWVATYGVVG